MVLLVVGAIGVSWYAYFLATTLTETKTELETRTALFGKVLGQLQQELKELHARNDDAMSVLSDQQKRTLELEEEKRDSEEKIEELTKLTTLDPELLQKYSKVYFLNENYIPRKLRNINSDFLVNPESELQILSDVRPFLRDMLEDAQDEGVELRVVSAYRSFNTQKQLKSAYTTQYGSGTANKFSAEQGYSEHQLGTTVDITTPSVGGLNVKFETTPAYAWLTEHAYEYGFVLSYPKGNKFYVYEPWHWRFVGKDLARHLHREEKHFYELDQRDIDEYLLNIFED